MLVNLMTIAYRNVFRRYRLSPAVDARCVNVCSKTRTFRSAYPNAGGVFHVVVADRGLDSFDLGDL